MGADVMLFLDDQFHISKSDVVFSASSVQNGYAIDNAREADLQRPYKPIDSSVDEWLKADAGTNAKLGIAGAQAYFAIAYDSRLAQQTKFVVQYGTTDDGAFAVPIDIAPTWTISGTNALDVNNAFLQFTVPTPAKRYYRLIQKVGDRASGTKTATVYNWAAYAATGVLSIDRYPGFSEGTYQITQEDRASSINTAGDVPASSSWANPGWGFDVNLEGADDPVWQEIRDQLWSLRGIKRAIYVVKEGLRNPAQPNFFLCYRDKPSHTSRLRFRGRYDMVLGFRTAAWI